MNQFLAFRRDAPSSLVLNAAPGLHSYRYFLAREGRLLGVLYHTSTHVAFEWITEGGALVPYGPEVRYRTMSKRDVALLVEAGLFEVGCEAQPAPIAVRVAR
jgi:hypothetical protein